LNAPGRLGDADPALRLLLASAAEADERAAALDEANTQRRGLQDKVLEEALATIEANGDPGPAIVVAGRGWTPGVVGIVAAKLVDLYRRPAFVVAIDEATGTGRGSARSASGVDLYRAMAACEARLIRFGGHAAAAGLTVAESEVPALREALCEAVTGQLAAAPSASDDDGCDAEVRLDEVDDKLATELGTLAPFGQGNLAPLLLTRGVLVRSSRRVGDGSHLKLEVEDAGHIRGAIGFGLGEQDPGAGARIDVGFTPAVSTWRGEQRVELEIRALAAAS
jgi:single-stranded-DNA-specific exonuclease